MRCLGGLGHLCGIKTPKRPRTTTGDRIEEIWKSQGNLGVGPYAAFVVGLLLQKFQNFRHCRSNLGYYPSCLSKIDFPLVVRSPVSPI